MYRLWNQRADSNHRYTADPATKALMLAKGYVAEGYGPDAVIMCTQGAAKGDDHPAPMKHHAVWVPAFAGTTAFISFQCPLKSSSPPAPNRDHAGGA